MNNNVSELAPRFAVPIVLDLNGRMNGHALKTVPPARPAPALLKDRLLRLSHYVRRTFGVRLDTNSIQLPETVSDNSFPFFNPGWAVTPAGIETVLCQASESVMKISREGIDFLLVKKEFAVRDDAGILICEDQNDRQDPPSIGFVSLDGEPDSSTLGVPPVEFVGKKGWLTMRGYLFAALFFYDSKDYFDRETFTCFPETLRVTGRGPEMVCGEFLPLSQEVCFRYIPVSSPFKRGGLRKVIYRKLS